MDLDFFKKQLDDIKQAKLETEEKERQEYNVLFEQAVNGLKELIEKLKPYIECAKKEFDLSDHIKEITNNVQYSYSSSIRWNKNFDEANFSYNGIGTSFSFSMNNLIHKNVIFGKHQLILIKNAFNPKNADYFLESLLKKLESNDIYIGNQY
jgi:hypothetical protein